MNKDILVRFPIGIVKRLDALVTYGLYPNRNEAIRAAVRDLIKADESLIVSSKVKDSGYA